MGSCAAPSAKGDDKFITTDYLQQCLAVGHVRDFSDLLNATGARGFFCHTGKTREGTKSLIRGDSRMILVSGQKLLDLIATDAPFIPYPGYRPPTEMVHPEQETT